MLRLIVLVFALLSLSQAGAASRDDDFLAARDAFRTGDAIRLNALAKRLNGDVLAPYLAYYQLQMRLKDASVEEVRSFIASNADSSLSDRLRADWLRILGQQQNWTLFEAEYPALVSNDDAELACFALQARLQRGDDTVTPGCTAEMAEWR